MELFDAIYQRRAIKAFDPEHIISADDEKKLFEAAIQAPTSFNIQHWRFVVVRDKVLRAEMRKLGNDQTQITDSSLLVIMTADMKAWQKDPSRYWVQAPKEVADLLVGWMGPFHDGRDWLQRDEAQRSIGMAMQTLMLAATDEGLASCAQGALGLWRSPLEKRFRIPRHYQLLCGVSLGFAADQPVNRFRPEKLPVSELMIPRRER